MAKPMFPSITLSLVLVLLFAGSSVTMGMPVWSTLPDSLRNFVILNRRSVPAYPEDADSLLQVRNWPKTRTFDGQVYSLEFSAMQSDQVMLHLTDLGQVPAGWGYGARYVRHSENDPSISRGPAYYWRNDGTLSERSYTSTSYSRIWEYCSPSVLHHYFFVPEDNKRQHPGFHEYFGPTGDLIGLNAGRKHYWLGHEVPVDSFFQHVNAVYAECRRQRR